MEIIFRLGVYTEEVVPETFVLTFKPHKMALKPSLFFLFLFSIIFESVTYQPGFFSQTVVVAMLSYETRKIN